MTTATLRMTGELEPRDSWSAGAECTIAKSVELLSARSAFLLMREAFYGATRFEEFVRRAELSEPAASVRLHELVEQGLLELEPYQEPGQRTRNRYLLTEKGADLFPVIVSLMQWGNRWLSDTGGPAGPRSHQVSARVSQLARPPGRPRTRRRSASGRPPR